MREIVMPTWKEDYYVKETYEKTSQEGYLLYLMLSRALKERFLRKTIYAQDLKTM